MLVFRDFFSWTICSQSFLWSPIFQATFVKKTSRAASQMQVVPENAATEAMSPWLCVVTHMDQGVDKIHEMSSVRGRCGLNNRWFFVLDISDIERCWFSWELQVPLQVDIFSKMIKLQKILSVDMVEDKYKKKIM